ncbi:MAG: glycosyltransferase family 39 protein [Planctomycetes bacterium]|nr:glycosyltransferase family 39 protein [Planctomycetota bacterium]
MNETGAPLPEAAVPPVRPLLRWAAWIVIVAVYVGLRAPLLEIPLDRDEGVFSYIALGVLRGEVPYREAKDYKPPGVFYMLALGLAFVPPTAAGIHFWLHLWNFGSLLLLASSAKALYGERAGLWTGFVYAFLSASVAVQGYTASTEMFLLLPLAASLRLTIAGATRTGRSSLVCLAAGGACAALACWTKQPALFSLLAVPIWLLFNGARPGIRAAFLRLGWWLAGGVVLSILIVAYFTYHLGLREFLYWAFPVKLYGTRWSYWWDTLWWTLKEAIWDHLPVLVLGAFGFLVRAFLRGKDLWFPIALFLLGIPAVFTGPIFYRHYFAVLTASIALFGGVGLGTVQEWHWILRDRTRAIEFTLVAGAICLSGALYAPRPYANVAGWTTKAHEKAAEALREAAHPGDGALLMIGRSQIAVMADLRLPSMFPMYESLNSDPERTQEFQLAAIARLRDNPPRFLIHSPGGDEHTCPFPPKFFQHYVENLRDHQYEPWRYIVVDPHQDPSLPNRMKKYLSLTPETFQSYQPPLTPVYVIRIPKARMPAEGGP